MFGTTGRVARKVVAPRGKRGRVATVFSAILVTSLVGVTATGEGAVSSTTAPPPASWVQAKPLLFAHKGLVGDAIRNTLPALTTAFANGADGVEFDTVKTKSGHLVVLSNTDLASSTNCKGNVEHWDYFALRAQCKTKDGRTIPNLYEALMVVRDSGGKLMLHVKINPDKKAARSIMAALNKYGLNRNGHATIFAFHPAMLDMLRAQGAARLGLIFNNTTTKFWTMRKYQALVPFNTPITQAQIRAAQMDGVEVYPVETHGAYPLSVEKGLAMGADGMILDSLAKAAGIVAGK